MVEPVTKEEKFSESETAELLKSPAALQALVDMHDYWESCSDAMDMADCAKHHKAQREMYFSLLGHALIDAGNDRAAHEPDAVLVNQIPTKQWEGSEEQRFDYESIGRALLESLASNQPNYCWNNCPSEIVTDLLNQLHDARASKPPSEGPFVVADGGSTGEKLFRTMTDGGCIWTLDLDEALQFARRKDAESFAEDDDDAWQIIPVPWEKDLRARLTKEGGGHV